MNLKELFNRNLTLRKTIGIVLVFVGFLALITPLTPGSWFILIGLELLGFRFLLIDKVKTWLTGRRHKSASSSEIL